MDLFSKSSLYETLNYLIVGFLLLILFDVVKFEKEFDLSLLHFIFAFIIGLIFSKVNEFTIFGLLRKNDVVLSDVRSNIREKIEKHKEDKDIDIRYDEAYYKNYREYVHSCVIAMESQLAFLKNLLVLAPVIFCRFISNLRIDFIFLTIWLISCFVFLLVCNSEIKLIFNKYLGHILLFIIEAVLFIILYIIGPCNKLMCLVASILFVAALLFIIYKIQYKIYELVFEEEEYAKNDNNTK